MDQGGNFPLLFGVGPDGVGGTADDNDVDFGEDVFNPNEGFIGIEDTLTRLAVRPHRLGVCGKAATHEPPRTLPAPRGGRAGVSASFGPWNVDA